MKTDEQKAGDQGVALGLTFRAAELLLTMTGLDSRDFRQMAQAAIETGQHDGARACHAAAELLDALFSLRHPQPGVSE